VASDDEAVKLANVVDFGPDGAVWSTGGASATQVTEQLEVGMADVNTPVGEGGTSRSAARSAPASAASSAPWASTNS
jgi:acyl-CoA reductase-like NAD-dependent aldehyde dehydrogenase